MTPTLPRHTENICLLLFCSGLEDVWLAFSLRCLFGGARRACQREQRLSDGFLSFVFYVTRSSMRDINPIVSTAF